MELLKPVWHANTRQIGLQKTNGCVQALQAHDKNYQSLSIKVQGTSGLFAQA